MRSFAIELGAQFPRCLGAANWSAVIRHAVRHDAGVEALPRTVLCHQPFSALGFFCRGSHYDDGAGEVVCFEHVFDGDGGGDGGGCD